MDVSDYESEELFSEDTATAPMNIDRKRVFCDHYQDYVDKSTFYRHQTLYSNMNTLEPFDLASDESDILVHLKNLLIQLQMIMKLEILMKTFRR